MRYNNEQYSKLNSIESSLIELNQFEIKQNRIEWNRIEQNGEQISRRDEIKEYKI